jgi:hypothetical protein
MAIAESLDFDWRFARAEADGLEGRVELRAERAAE